jgi:Fur family peroxide stress response transcriptional regulator
MRRVPSDFEPRLTRFREACKQAGVKMTHQRMEIFREVVSRDDHPDATSVFAGVHQRMPTVSMDTVYRTLAMLTEIGVIAVLGPRHESVRFDANPVPHHHYVCTRCGAIRDFSSAELGALTLPAHVASFGTVEAMRLEARGVCAVCLGSAPRAEPGRVLPGGGPLA